jgi:hypothetical protein
MRFQHGVDDKPTRLPISATDSEASSLHHRQNLAIDGVHLKLPLARRIIF